MIYLSEKPMLIIRDINIEDNNGIFDIANIDQNNIDSGLIQYISVNLDKNNEFLNPNNNLNKIIKNFLSRVYSTYISKIKKIPIYISVPSKKNRNPHQELFFQKINSILSKENVYFTNSDNYGFKSLFR